MPPEASVAYTEAMSRGVTAPVPRASEGAAWSSDRTPSFCAMAAIASAPRSSASRAYTVLSEWIVAAATDSGPA